MPEKIDTEIRTKGVFEEGGTPLYQFSEGLGLRGPTTGELLGESRAISERRAGRMETSAADLEAKARDVATLSTKQAATRTAERPAPYVGEKTPSLEARPFLSPPHSVLGQIQNILIGVGQLATGIAGTKGKGYAIGATAALKGAVEGWQAGDADRTARALEQWKVENDRLLNAHKAARERYQDILEDQTRTMQDRLSQIGLTAQIAGMQDLAEAARSGDVDRVLKIVEAGKDREITVTGLAVQLEHYRALQETARASAIRQEQGLKLREEAGGRSERRTKLLEETSGGMLKLQSAETGLTQKIDNAAVVRDAVELLDREGILPRGATVWDKGKAAIALQSKPGRADIAKAVQIVNRLGTPLVIGTEVGLGTTGSALRLKVIGEAEAGNLIGAPKQFWDLFLPMAEKKWRADRSIAREHLRTLGRLQAPQELTISADEWGE